MTPDTLAADAASLRDNEAFQRACDVTRADALDKLSTIDADDKNGILKLQATVAVVDEIRGHIEQFIRSGTKPKPPGIA